MLDVADPLPVVHDGLVDDKGSVAAVGQHMPDVEAFLLAGVGPATAEIFVAVDMVVERTGEAERIADEGLDRGAVGFRPGGVIAGDHTLHLVGGDHALSLRARTTCMAFSDATCSTIR